MKILVLGGAGAMGSLAVRDLVESPEVSEVVIGDIDIEKANQYADKLGSEKLSTEYIDIFDHEKLVKMMNGFDTVANATWYYYNVSVMKAAIQAGVNYTDLGGLYHITLKQLELNDQAKNAGMTAVICCGIGPGINNVLANYGANKLDQVEEIHIRCAVVDGPTYTYRALLDEYTMNPVVYRTGQYIEVAPRSGKETIEFPEPIGKVEAYYSLHSEVATLPRFLGVTREVDFKIGFPVIEDQRIKPLVDLGLTSVEPIKVKDAIIEPREFLIAFLTSLRSKEARRKETVGVRVEVKGMKNNEKIKYTYESVNKPHERWDTGAEPFMTGISLSIVNQMLARGDIQTKGVYPPEACVEPEAFIAELVKRGIRIQETVEKTRTV